MSQKIKINLPQYLVLFLTRKYGTDFKATRHSIMGNFAIDLLTKNYVRNKKIDTDSYFSFKVSKEMLKTHGNFIMPERFKDFERKINMLFNEALYAHVLVSVNSDLLVQGLRGTVKQTAMNSITEFLHYYGITEDHLKLETVYRQYLRINERIESVKNGTKKERPSRKKESSDLFTESIEVKTTKQRQKPNTSEKETSQHSLFLDFQ